MDRPGSQEMLYPIHLAAKLGDALALQALIDAGADLTKKRLGARGFPFSGWWWPNGDLTGGHLKIPKKLT